MADYPNTKTGTIDAGNTADVTMNTAGCSRAFAIVKNTGLSNAITSTTVYKSPLASLYAQDAAATTAIGSISAGASVLVEFSDLACDRIKLTLASTSGTDYTVEWRAY